MIAPHDHADPNAREIARGLAAAIAAVLAASHEPAATVWNAAGEVADLLQLPGLGALLVACRAHAAQPPTDVTHALERLARLARETETQGSLVPFTVADPELASLAGMLVEQEWSVPSDASATPIATQSLAELLSDLHVQNAALLERCRLSLPVAAGLRAAIDWLGGGATRALRITLQDAVVTIGLRVEHEPGLAPAGAVLALTGGALLRDGDESWAIRVPLHSERPAFLLARQGALMLAIPWHAVARLRLVTEAGRASLAEPSLTPWSPLEREQGERPVALVAQGLVHAWLHLDEIVWRVFAEPVPAIGPVELPGVRTCVQTPDGEGWWVVEPNVALQDVAPLVTPPTRSRGRERIETPESAPMAQPARPSAVEPGEPRRAAAVEAPDAMPRIASAGSGLIVLGREHVRPFVRPRPSQRRSEPQVVVLVPPPLANPLAARPAALEPDVNPMPASLAAGSVTPVVPAPAGPPAPAAITPLAPMRALIADDSLVARLALARVLEREGWGVEMVERASEMWQALEEGDFGAVFVDVSLPDARGREHLRELVARQLVTAARFEVVALPRDRAEEQVVRECGIARALRKPFAAGIVEALVHALRPADRA